MALKIATQGGTAKEVPYRLDMNIGDALNSAGIKPDKQSTITVNGKDADLTTILNDNDLVVITPNISNG